MLSAEELLCAIAVNCWETATGKEGLTCVIRNTNIHVSVIKLALRALPIDQQL